MIKGKNILCFGSENWDYPGFQQTIMRKLSPSNKIIYVNPLGTRKLSLKYSQFSFYFRRAFRYIEKSKSYSYNTMVCNPNIIPIIYSKVITIFNRLLIKYQFAKVIKENNFEEHILWIGTPSASFLMDLFKPILTVYNPVDRYSKFPFVNADQIRRFEQKIAKESDVIICTSDEIRNDFLPYNSSSFTISHGVDFNHFNSANSSDIVPQDLKNIKKPIIGYFGGLSSTVFDIDLVLEIAKNFEHANIVLIGNFSNNLDKAKAYKNIYILGFKDHTLIPLYLKQFTVCIIPFYLNELMKGVDPIKLREYMCLGKPIVSTSLPEISKFSNIVYLAQNKREFVRSVGKALKEKDKTLIKKRIYTAQQESWENKIAYLSYILLKYLKEE